MCKIGKGKGGKIFGLNTHTPTATEKKGKF